MGKLFAFTKLLKTGRVALRLMKDRRVPLHAKLVMVGAVVYALSPLDFIPDFIPILGQLDDVAVLAAGLSLFIRLCPPEVVEEHEVELGRRSPERPTYEGVARPVPPNEPVGGRW